jgi:hypothetical protein
LKDKIKTLFDQNKLKAGKARNKNLSEELADYIIDHTANCHGDMSERIYWVLNGLTDYYVCETCGRKITSFRGIHVGYSSTKSCSNKCAHLNPKVIEKTKETKKAFIW